MVFNEIWISQVITYYEKWWSSQGDIGTWNARQVVLYQFDLHRLLSMKHFYLEVGSLLFQLNIAAQLSSDVK